MTDMSTEKICVLCREDCSYKPRIKDSHGNYYCKNCHQAAEQRKTGRKAPPPRPPRPVEIEAVPKQIEAPPKPIDAPVIDDLSISLDGEHDDSFGDGIDLAASDSVGEDEMSLDSNQGVEGMQLELDEVEPAPPDQRAVEAGNDLNTMLREEAETEDPESEPATETETKAETEENDPYMILKDSKSEAMPAAEADDAPTDAFGLLEEMADRQLSEAAEALPVMEIEAPATKTVPPVMPAPPSVATDSRTAFWPFVIGIFALLFGGFGATVMTMGLFGNITRRMDRGFYPESILDHFLLALIVPAIFALLGGWEALAGFGLLLKKTFGARALRYWARINVICVATFIVAVIGYFVYLATSAQNSSSTDARTYGLIGDFAISLSFVGLIMLIWPIFLLIWFRRENVKADIDSWG